MEKRENFPLFTQILGCQENMLLVGKNFSYSTGCLTGSRSLNPIGYMTGHILSPVKNAQS